MESRKKEDKDAIKSNDKITLDLDLEEVETVLSETLANLKIKYIEDGRKEGKELGIKEGILGEKLETAKRLLAKNFSLDIIQKATNLTIYQIKSCVE